MTDPEAPPPEDARPETSLESPVHAPLEAAPAPVGPLPETQSAPPPVTSSPHGTPGRQPTRLR